MRPVRGKIRGEVKMADNKTSWTAESVSAFLEAVPNAQRRVDGKTLCALIERAVGERPRMWGPSIVGFGRYRYRYESGRVGEAAAAGFSPRGRELVIYLPTHSGRTEALLDRLGKHKIGKCCVYINKLADVDETVLGELVADSYRAVKAQYPDA
jgi:hypothetical protein